ncbi:unnamed protein product [Ixodes persulcatus]
MLTEMKIHRKWGKGKATKYCCFIIPLLQCPLACAVIHLILINNLYVIYIY